MDTRKRRSSLRKSLAVDTTSVDSKNPPKRRISFSGKKSVRVFSKEDEPKAWNNSFEISDCLNANEAEINLKEKKLLLSLKENLHENKENIIEYVIHKNQTNLCIRNTDSLNVTDQFTSTCQIANSVDFTLIENEKRFQTNDASINFLSFSLEDGERRAQICEKTCDFLRDLTNNSEERENSINLCDISNKKEVVQNNENVSEISHQHSEYTKSMKEPMSIKISNTFSNKCDAQTFDTVRKSVYEESVMQLTFNKTQECNKEYLNPFSAQKANKTQNRTCEMEIEDELPLDAQENKNLNKIKLRSTIYFDQPIETTPIKNMNIPTKKLAENIAFDDSKTFRPSIYFNQSMDIDQQTTTVGDSNKGAIPKVKPSSILFKEAAKTSPISLGTNLGRKTIHLNEDMDTSHLTLSQEPNSCKNLSVSTSSHSIQKYNPPSKIVFRKICLPIPNRTEKFYDKQKKIMLRINKEQEENFASRNDSEVTCVKRDEPSKIKKNLNLSLENLKNFSFSSVNSPPLIPLDYKGYTLKQLNDEIECGNINVFENVPKTPAPNLNNSNSNSEYQQDNNHLTKSEINKTTSLDFNNEDIPTNCNKDKYRYSQADEMMLDNTTFLTRAKLSDETMSHKSSKRDSTQLNDSIHIFHETFAEAANNLEDDTYLSSKITNICNQDNNTNSSKRENTLKNCAPKVADENNTNNFICSIDKMDNSQKFEERKHDTYAADINISLLQQIEERQKPERLENLSNIQNKENIPIPRKLVSSSNPIRKPFCNTKEIPLENMSMEIQENDQTIKTNTCSKTILFETKIQDESDNMILRNSDIASSRTSRKTLHYNKEIILEKSNLNNADHVQSEVCLSQNSNTKTLYLKTKIKDDSYFNDKGMAMNNIGQMRRSVFYDNEIILEEKSSPIHQKNIPNKTLFINDNIPLEEESRFAEYKEAGSSETNICLPKPIRKTLLCEIPMEEDYIKNNDKNTNVANFNFNPSRKTLHYNNDISLQSPNLGIAEQIEAQTSKLCVSQNPTRKTVLFEANIPEETILKDEKLRVRNSDHTSGRKTLHNNDEISLEEETAANICLQNLIRNPLLSDTRMEEDSLVNSDKNTNVANFNFNPSRKTLHYNNDISLQSPNLYNVKEIEAQTSKLCVSQNPTRKTVLFETNIAEEKILKDENHRVRNAGHTSGRKTLHFNDEIPLEEETANICLPKSEEKTLFFESKMIEELITNDGKEKDGVSENANSFRKTLYYNHEISSEDLNVDNVVQAENFKDIRVNNVFETNIQEEVIENLKNTQKKTDNSETSNFVLEEELLDVKNDSFDMNKYDGNKSSGYQSKHYARRKSVYTPENMELTQNGKAVNEIVTMESIDQIEMPEDIARKITYENESRMRTKGQQFSLSESNDSKEVDDFDQSLKSDENLELPKAADSINIANMLLSRRFSKTAFATPKKSIGNNRNFSICMTPRLSLLEFLEQEETENREINHKRLSVDLTPVLSLPKKKFSSSSDNCLQKSDSPVTKTREGVSQCVDNQIADTVLNGSIANVSVLQTPMREKKSRIPIPLNSANKINKSYYFIDTFDSSQKELNSHLEIDTDHFGDSIELMRRATASVNPQDEILKQNINFEPPKQSVYEGNPITVSDVTVFFEAERKSNIDITKAEQSLEKNNSFLPKSIDNTDRDFKDRFINLTLEDIDKTHLSLVRKFEDEDDDDTANVIEFKQENQAIKEESLKINPVITSSTFENRKEQNCNLRNESMVCRKCKRCQETFANETNSSIAESFVMPELPPLPYLGLDRLRRLRMRPSIADVNMLWKRFSLDRTLYKANISDDDIELLSDDEETQDKSSEVTKFIEKFHADMRSIEMQFSEKLKSTASSQKLPFVLRLETLLRDHCTNWIFDYQTQFRGMFLFKHRKLYTFTLMLTFEEVDHFGHEISLKSVQLEKGHVPKKNWMPIDFIIEHELKLNLPFNLQWMCKSSTESDILQMLQQIDRSCLDTLKLANDLQFICFSNQASIKSYIGGGGTYVRKIFRRIDNLPNTNFKVVKKTEIHVELLNLKKLSFKDITFPKLHNFREEVHLLPTGLEFLQEFLPNALDYLKEN